MATQLEAFRLLIPEFASSSDATVQSFLDIAPLFIDHLKFSEETRGLALVYQAASLMYQQKQSATGESSGMDKISEREGDLSRSYGSSSKSTSGVTKDIYLQMLDTLSRSFTTSAIMTRFGTA